MAVPGTAFPGSVPFDPSCVIVDVRTGVEHAGLALKQQHHHIPLGELDAAKFLQENKIDAARPVYTLCRSGKRATDAALAFIAAGHENVHVIEGGIIACEAAGIPVRKGDVMSLERQVRIAAGFLVVTGVTLGAAVSPWFYVLSGFVGGGLVFAGVTDSCGMAFLLAKAPWNRGLQKKAEATTACSGTAPACGVAAAAGDAQALRMPEGTSFYSPATGKPAALPIYALTKTGGSAGGCS